jgi:hypothetical protein
VRRLAPEEFAMDRDQASQDLALVDRVLDQTRQRVDPQLFHAIHWGVIVLVWYPTANWLDQHGKQNAEGFLGLGALVLGCALSTILGWRANRQPRLPAANAHLGSQIGKATAVFVGTGVLFSIATPILAGEAAAQSLYLVWGTIYALMFMTIGVFHSREIFWCGVPSLVATIVALKFPEHAGYVVGPVMGLGSIAAGVIAERRVARLRREGLASVAATVGAHE